jgi:F-type H+-transporting ATPase subunit gamma
MPSLKELRGRINSVKSTRKITSAMKMVAASKLRRAQNRAEAARPYAERMQRMLESLARSVGDRDDAPALLRGNGRDQTHLLVVVTADRGLAGGFNSNVARYARNKARKLQSEGKTVKLLTVGRKGTDILRRDFRDAFLDQVTYAGEKTIGFANAEAVGETIVKAFEDNQFDRVTLIYNRFVNVMSQVPSEQTLIPLSVPENDNDKGEPVPYEFEPDEETILRRLLPRNIGIQIYRALLESAAGEQGARMAAMDNATRNAGKAIDRLSLRYNQTRQANITRELIEIISGAEAL